MWRLNRKNPALRLGQGLLFGLLCAALVAGAGSAGRLRSFDRSILDGLFNARGALFPSPDVVIIEADDATVVRNRRWPFPREVYADVVRQLTRAGVKTIAFDVLFNAPSELPKSDAEFVRACVESNRVIQAAAFDLDSARDPFVSLGSRGTAPQILSRFGVVDDNGRCRETGWGTAPLPLLQKSAVALGHVNAPPEEDGVLRRIPHVIRFRSGQRETVYPSLALSAAAHFLDVDAQNIIAKGDKIVLRAPGGTRELPVDSQGSTWVNWIAGNRAFPTYSFNQILDGDVEDEALRGKVVIIGITAAGAFERHATPFSHVQPAVELQANALDDILMQRPLQAAPSSLNLAFLLILPMLVGIMAARRSATVSALWTAGLCAGVWILALQILARNNYILPVAGPLLAAGLTWAISVGFDQVRSARDLKMAEERYALAVRGANDGLWDWNLKTDEIYFSPRWKAMLGHNDSEIAASPEEWFSRIHTDDVEAVRAAIKSHIEDGSSHFEHEYRIAHKDGHSIWVLSRGLRVCDAEGKPSRMAGSQSDITDQVEAKEQLRHNAFFDALTNLPNRALFMDRLGRALARAKRRDDYLFAVLFLDLDRFKVVNDSLGHAAGDTLLIQVARRLELCLRPGDTAARLGGDEFTVLLDDISDVAGATRVVERIQHELATPFEMEGNEVFPTASIGIALSAPTYEYPEDLLRDADTAMYRAKALGRSRHAVFDEAMHAQALGMLRLETDLRRALERQNFQVFYQPIVSFETGEVAGFEALARWNHPERGMVSPGEFIALAEETGLIIPIDHYVLREACTQTQLWQKLFPGRPLTISVNLSSKQFGQADLVEQITQTIREVG
ncbi:MAG TPA: CHASE2 domain-containing protein, partial [Abditibacteriaceae bacterium]